MKTPVRFGSRDSALAVIQARLVMDAVARAHPELALELVTMKTLGDLTPEAPIEGGTDGKALFTAGLEEALAEGRIDLCVHSLKDMSVQDSPDFPIVGMMKRGDPRDALVLPPGRSFEGFEKTPSPVGCSSRRRVMQFLALSPSAAATPVRGNVPTRLAKLDSGDYGALILAAAGLERLGLLSRASYLFPVREITPAAGQGTLAIQGRQGGDYGFLDAARDPAAEEEAAAERQVIRVLGAGCGAPAGAYAVIQGTEISITGFYAPPEGAGAPFCRAEVSGTRERALFLAEELAGRLLSGGRP